MNEDDFEIDTGSRDRLHGVKQEDPILKLKRREEVGGPGKTNDLRERVGRWTLAPRANRCYDNEEAAIFDCSPVIIDSANETMYR